MCTLPMQILWGFVCFFLFFLSFFLSVSYSGLSQPVGKLLVFSCGKWSLINNFQFLNREKKIILSLEMSTKDPMKPSVHTDWEN